MHLLDESGELLEKGDTCPGCGTIVKEVADQNGTRITCDCD